MTPERYLTCLEADAARIAEVARSGLSAPVPSCPEWTVRDLVDHVAHVFLHKVEAIRNGAPPDPWPPPELAGRDPMELYDAAAAALLSELRKRGPSEPAWSWWPADQTTGFWFRRMAHEAAVHRVDAELAHDAVTPVDAELALDGIDEVLRRFLGEPWWTDNTELPLRTTVRVTSAERSWTVTFAGGQVTVEDDGSGPVAAEVSGDAEAVLLWLWGRRGDDQVRSTGDPHVLTQFRQRLAEATG
jgi:uncharacterized protein (TIGR03083 family)